MNAATEAIAIDTLTKNFGAVRALDGLNLRVERGEVHGFLGPNGAGKSTTIRILLGLVRADSGSVRLLGGDPWTDAVALHRHIAYVPGDVTLWPTLTGGETIDLLARMRGGIDERRRAELTERFDLDPTKKARTYSKGNRQKVSLISAFASNADLLLLDEPSSSMDHQSEEGLKQRLRRFAASKTMILVTHRTSLLDLVDRLIVLDQGQIVADGPKAQVVEALQQGRIGRAG